MPSSDSFPKKKFVGFLYPAIEENWSDEVPLNDGKLF